MSEPLTEADVAWIRKNWADDGVVMRLLGEWRSQCAELAERDKRIASLEKLTGQLTNEEAQAAYEAAEPIPVSRERIEEIVKFATQPSPEEKAWRAWADRVTSTANEIRQACPNDTDGDGNCGRQFCPYCGNKVQAFRAVLAERPK